MKNPQPNGATHHYGFIDGGSFIIYNAKHGSQSIFSPLLFNSNRSTGNMTLYKETSFTALDSLGNQIPFSLHYDR